MKNKLVIAMVISLVAYPYILTAGSTAANGAAGRAGSGQNTAQFSSDELDNLLAPIALYPDPLLAQIFPAATFVDQIAQAAAWLRSNNNPDQIDGQSWDVSVKAVAHYPQILYKMSDQLDWTTALGQAYVGQSTDVMASIQRLRVEARNAGTLVTTPQQQVTVDNGYVAIVPAQPTVIYVPQYDPEIVYTAPSTGAIIASSLISFGTGLAIGAWLNRGWNWGGGGIYYHGWRGGGWIGAARPYVNWHNGAYVNNRFNNININRNVVNRNINAANLNRYNSVHRNTNWGSVDRANMTRHARPAPGTLPARPGAGTLPARPGTPGGRPGTAGTRPVTPGTRPGTAGTRPASPGTLPARPGAPRARPGTLPGNAGASRPGATSRSNTSGMRGTPRASSPGGGHGHGGGAARSHGGGGGRAHGGGGGRGGGGRRR